MQTQILTEVVKHRQTQKVLASPDQPAEFNDTTLQSGNREVFNAIDVAGWAPFHFDRAVDGIAEPWRVHVLWEPACRDLSRQFHTLFTDVKPSNKLPNMLAACGALVLVTWLPQFSSDEAKEADPTVGREKQIEIDEEHLAATAAMVQNLLLLLTAGGLGTYWSSGGQLKSPAAFEHLGIGGSERLLAAVFVDYAPTQQKGIERLPGKNREKRSAAEKWTRQVDLD